MNIGTAKPDEAEKEGIPHYMLDVVEPWEEYSVAQYAENARACIREVIKKGKLPIVVGGTGLYINTLVENIEYSASPEMDTEILAEIEKFYAENGAEALHSVLESEDPEAAKQIHFNNVKRVIRALGMKRTTGLTLAQRNAASKSSPKEFDFTVYAIDTPRDVLYNRINVRVDKMLEMGLLDEVKHVMALCENKLSKTALQAIGYKEFIDYFNGICDLDTAIERVKQGSRNYAKRQLTWFRKPSWVNWISLDELIKL
jgi:tRNA dimethylallyltransferase